MVGTITYLLLQCHTAKALKIKFLSIHYFKLVKVWRHYTIPKNLFPPIFFFCATRLRALELHILLADITETESCATSVCLALGLHKCSWTTDILKIFRFSCLFQSAGGLLESTPYLSYHCAESKLGKYSATSGRRCTTGRPCW